MRFIAIGVLGLVLVWSVISYLNRSKRNSIVFRDPISAVRDSIKVMNQYMSRLPKEPVNNVFFDREDFVYVNNKKLGKIEATDFLKNVRHETDFSEKDASRFMVLAAFLKNNYLDGCFVHLTHQACTYIYRRTNENNWNDLRNIVLSSDLPKKISQTEYELLDTKDGLCLLALPDKE